MNYIEYIEKIQNIQQNILEYIDDDSEDKFQNIKDILAKNKIKDNQDEFKSFLYFLSKISNYHYRATNFFSKIYLILDYLKNDLLKSFSNSELFHIFRSSKRILLFLVESKIMIIDKSIINQITRYKYQKSNYPQYFQPEIRLLINQKWFPNKKYRKGYKDCWILEIEKEIPEDFYERRRIGENDHFICELIRKDSLDDFIVYINQNNYQLNSIINPSIYETNNFLLKKETSTLIEYAAFFGSIQIFNYLRINGADLTPSLWYYAIHGKNAEIIQILEEKQLESYDKVFKESIRCHHNDIADYIQNNYFGNENKDEEYVIVNSLRYYNFTFIKKEQINETLFNYLCKYDYYALVSNILNTKNIDINHVAIYKLINFNSIFKIKINK